MTSLAERLAEAAWDDGVSIYIDESARQIAFEDQQKAIDTALANEPAAAWVCSAGNRCATITGGVATTGYVASEFEQKRHNTLCQGTLVKCVAVT